MFFGREWYMEDLKSLWKKRTSSLVACRGRRRVGKSTLFREFARRTSQVYLEFEGLAPRACSSNQGQVDAFLMALASQAGCKCRPSTNWYDAFHQLDDVIDDGKKTVVLLDEVSWMGAYDRDFPAHLRTAWETFFHRHDKLIVGICGSASAWIKENILNDAGFTGRISRDYILPELPLRDCVKFWGRAAGRVAPREILDVLSVTGGVPRYLEEMDPGLTADENISRMCFRKEGELYKDFNNMFAEIFGEDLMLRRKILRLLAERPMSGDEMAKSLGVDNNGHFSAQVRSLSEAGFIAPYDGLNPATGKPVRVGRYRLRDNYARFYLRYIEPHRSEIEAGAFRFSSVAQLPGWNTMLGLQFENLVVNNYQELVPRLGIGSTIIRSAAPFSNVNVQVDLLILTARTAYVIEIKRRRYIDEGIEREMAEKIKRLNLAKGVTPRPVLVYDGELEPSVEGSGYFDALIPAAELLGTDYA